MSPTRKSPSGQATASGAPAGPGQRPRRVPQRTCVACRRTGDQRSFVRLVRAEDGGAEIDERGRAPGRGAYLCRDIACWERAAKGALDAPLRTKTNEAGRAALTAYGAQFTTTAPAEPEGGDAPTTAASTAEGHPPAESESV